jgi:hypothetical protein
VSHPVTEPTGPDATGDQRVDRVLASLDVLPGLAVADHVAVFEQAHLALRDALADAGSPAHTGAGNPSPNAAHSSSGTPAGAGPGD